MKTLTEHDFLLESLTPTANLLHRLCLSNQDKKLQLKYNEIILELIQLQQKITCLDKE